jgi:hypothetical protein
MLPFVKLARRYRRSIAIIAMAALAFAQAAVAMHACVIPVPVQTAMPCHDEPSPGPTALCQAHCQVDKQTVDKAKPLAALDVTPPLLTLVATDSGAPPLGGMRAQAVLTHAASPPLSILYQRLRN